MGLKFHKKAAPDTLVVTRELHEITILHRPRSGSTVFCDECASDVSWMRPDEFGALARISERQVFRLIEAGRIHLVGPENSATRVCVNSIPRMTEEKLCDQS